MQPGSSDGPPSNASLFDLAPDGVCRAADVTADPVSSYLTLSPLPRGPRTGGAAVCFLWHFPRGRPHQPLAGILPCGARTFLPRRELRPRRARPPGPLQRLRVNARAPSMPREIRPRARKLTAFGARIRSTRALARPLRRCAFGLGRLREPSREPADRRRPRARRGDGFTR